MPSFSQKKRWALTPPFHPYLHRGGIFSVALSIQNNKIILFRELPGSVIPWCPDFPHTSFLVAQLSQKTSFLIPCGEFKFCKDFLGELILFLDIDNQSQLDCS